MKHNDTLQRAAIALLQSDAVTARALCEPLKRSDEADSQFAYGLTLLCCGDVLAAEKAYVKGTARTSAWDWLDDQKSVHALQRQMERQPDLKGANDILASLIARRDELVAEWPRAPAPWGNLST